MPTPIQERAYGNLSITLSTINKQYFLIQYYLFYNLNPTDDSYTGQDVVNINIPISNINCQIVQSLDQGGQEINSSMVIKNNEDTVLTLNSNEWYVGTGKMTNGLFDTFLQYIYSASFA